MVREHVWLPVEGGEGGLFSSRERLWMDGVACVRVPERVFYRSAQKEPFLGLYFVPRAEQDMRWSLKVLGI